MSEIFDIDQAAKDFDPTRVKFRGEVYVLGGSVLSLLSAASIFTDDVLGEDADDSEFVNKVFEYLRPVIRALSPEMAAVMDAEDLTPAEEAALLKPVTKAVSSLAGLSFRTDGDDTGDGGEVPALLPAVPTAGSEGRDADAG